VSRQIRDLEDEVGLPLLKRAGKSVRLTEAGRVFLSETVRPCSLSHGYFLVGIHGISKATI
jgi:hypothetical protein